MFKIIDIGVKLEQIPNWVWASLVVGCFFFGVLYVVPEARQAMGHLFAAGTADKAKFSSTSKSEAERVCGADFTYVYGGHGRSPYYICGPYETIGQPSH